MLKIELELEIRNQNGKAPPVSLFHPTPILVHCVKLVHYLSQFVKTVGLLSSKFTHSHMCTNSVKEFLSEWILTGIVKGGHYQNLKKIYHPHVQLLR